MLANIISFVSKARRLFNLQLSRKKLATSSEYCDKLISQYLVLYLTVQT